MKLGDKLRKTREKDGVNIPDMADRLGVNKNTLGAYERGERLPDIDFLISFANKTSEDFLLLLELRIRESKAPGAKEALALLDAVGDALGNPAIQTMDIGKEFALVPQYDVEISAGHGRFEQHEIEIGKLAFRRDWLRQKGLSEKSLVVVRINGDSMSPTIRDGALALVDTRRNDIKEDGIYVLTVDGHLVAKRLQRDFKGGVYIRSDNAAYREHHLFAVDTPSLHIIGRVVWAAGEV